MDFETRNTISIWVLIILLLLIALVLIWRYYGLQIEELDRNSAIGILLRDWDEIK